MCSSSRSTSAVGILTLPAAHRGSSCYSQNKDLSYFSSAAQGTQCEEKQWDWHTLCYWLHWFLGELLNRTIQTCPSAVVQLQPPRRSRPFPSLCLPKSASSTTELASLMQQQLRVTHRTARLVCAYHPQHAAHSAQHTCPQAFNEATKSRTILCCSSCKRNQNAAGAKR